MESHPLKNALGRVFTPGEVAEYLGVDVESARKHYAILGGMRLGRRILFFEKLIVEAIRRNCHALQGEEPGRSVAGEGDEARPHEDQAISDQKGSNGLGGGTKRAAVECVLKRDTHGIFPR